MYQYLVLNIDNSEFQSLLIILYFYNKWNIIKIKCICFILFLRKGLAGLKESSIALKGENFLLSIMKGRHFTKLKKQANKHYACLVIL